MIDHNILLRKRFARFVAKKWQLNNRSETHLICVYAILSFDCFSNFLDIAYIGSTTCLKSRWKTHNIPDKISDAGFLCCLYYKRMDKGFYDYEIKLIKKLKPFFNKQHIK